MLTTTLAKLTGCKGVYHATGSQYGLHFPVELLDSRQVFGRVDYLIRPIGGYGSHFVSSDNVSVEACNRKV